MVSPIVVVRPTCAVLSLLKLAWQFVIHSNVTTDGFHTTLIIDSAQRLACFSMSGTDGSVATTVLPTEDSRHVVPAISG